MCDAQARKIICSKVSSNDPHANLNTRTCCNPLTYRSWCADATIKLSTILFINVFCKVCVGKSKWKNGTTGNGNIDRTCEAVYKQEEHERAINDDRLRELI